MKQNFTVILISYKSYKTVDLFQGIRNHSEDEYMLQEFLD